MSPGTQPFEVLVQRDCLGGERVVEVELSRACTEEDLARIPGVGSKRVLRSLPRPFFRVDVPGSFLLSGILGGTQIRFTVRLACRDRALPIALEASARLMGERE